ncbi:cytochrome P450 [Xylaria sp. CBS 124048]|nr:cytochrome P450 [Xylaria sp. CBS 124048]
MSVSQRPLGFYAKFIFAAIVLNYVIVVSKYHWVQRTKGREQLPPAYPAFIPWIGNLIPLIWDNEQFFKRVTSYQGCPTAARVGIMGHDIHLFQDPASIRKMWRTPSLSSPIKISTYTFKYFFGVPEKTLKVYRSDNSGPYRKPYQGSSVPENKRVDYLGHHEFLRALSGPGLAPTFQRFKRRLETMLSETDVSEAWTGHDDFKAFFQDSVGPALIESVYGPALLRLSPTFVADLYAFDDNVPWLARGIPSFLMPRPYRLRERLAGHMRRWHEYARQNFNESSIYEDGDGDPFWGSAFIRNRHTMFANIGDHDENAVAALDIGLAFGLVSNVSPAALLTAWHIFKDASLLRRIRSEIAAHLGTTPLRDADPKILQAAPLLQSVYAEALRLYTNIYVMVSSPQGDVPLERWRLPKDSIALLNSSVSHRDAHFWNTRDGKHPIDSFWADRFVTDPRDASSGPINPALRPHGSGAGGAAAPSRGKGNGGGAPFFSTDGLEAAWFPYGGGYSICPGRHLAKNIIMFISAILVTEFDVEFLVDELVLDKWRFGLGIAGPTNKIPFRIRRR